MAFKTVSWVGASADWGAAASNWSGADFPTVNNNVVINRPAVVVTYSPGDTFTVNSLTVLGTAGLDMTGGTLSITTTASFADGFTQTGGTLSVGGAVTVKGAGTLTGGIAQGGTAFSFDGNVTLANYTFTAAASFANKGTTSQTGQITVQSFGVKAAINNEKGGTYAIEGDFGIGRGPLSVSTANFINAGTLEKTGGSNFSVIAVNVTDTGKINVAIAGTLEFAGSQNSFAGAISGIGTIYLGAGSIDAINRGTTITAATFTISDSFTVATLNENLAFAHTFNLQNGAVLDLAAVTLTLSGADTFSNSAALGGNGTVVTAKGSTTAVVGSTFFLDGGATWQNFGTVGGGGFLQLGDTTFNAASFVNGKGGVYQFTGDVGIQSGTALISSFVNNPGAILEKTGGTGTSTISVAVTDRGAIIVETGTIDFIGHQSFFVTLADSFAGAISGNGQFEIGDGFHPTAATLAAGAAISTKTFTVNGAIVTFGESLKYVAGAFNLANSVLSLNGFSLTVSGTDVLSNSTIDGTGAFVTDKNSSVSLSGLTLGSAAKWQNSGTVTETNTFQLGDQSFDASSFTNLAGGHFFLAGDVGIGIGFNPNSSFVNSAGATFAKQSGGGDSNIGNQFAPGPGMFVNSGTVTVDTGEIEFWTLVSGKGTFTIEQGTFLRFDAAVAVGSTVKFASHSGGDLILTDSSAFKAAISGFGGTNTDQIELRDLGGTVTLKYIGTTTKGVLSVSGTNTQSGQPETVQLTFLGNYKLSNFHASANPSGGTLIVDPPAHPMLLASTH
jgi:hypothetical protein